MPSFPFQTVGYDGSVFSDFHVRKDASSGPGWFIFGRNTTKYGTDAEGKGRYVMLCGYRTTGWHPHYNGRPRKGWRTRREAAAALSEVGA